MTAVADWGVPDWHDGGAYPAPRMPLQRWAWEFVRRNPVYRHAWGERILPVTADDPHITSLWIEFEDRFGFYPPADPRDCDITVRFTTPFQGVYQGVRGSPNPFETSIDLREYDPSIAFVQFDVRWPIAEQLRRAQRRLDAMAERNGAIKPARPQRRLLPLYLRVLDADDTGASDAEIASVLAPYAQDPENAADIIYNYRRAARAWRDSGYLRLANLERP